jgi:hypothetical protein
MNPASCRVFVSVRSHEICAETLATARGIVGGMDKRHSPRTHHSTLPGKASSSSMDRLRRRSCEGGPMNFEALGEMKTAERQ